MGECFVVVVIFFIHKKIIQKVDRFCFIILD